MPVRRNIAHLTQTEREEFVAAIRQVDLLAYADGVSYWDKQDQIHQGTHNHGGPSFVPWHRELVNRFEKHLQQVNPNLALHYWDWTEDPRAADDGQGGTVNLMTDNLMGTANGVIAGELAPLHNGGVLAGSRDDTGDPADPPQQIDRNIGAGAPGITDDNTLIDGVDGLPQGQQFPSFRSALESAHDGAHGYFGPGSTITSAHRAFEDPFVFLLHCNVDRLFAMWQAKPGFEWRLDPDQVYGDESNTTGPDGILDELQPWNGTVLFGAPIEPWTGASPEIVHKTCRDPSVVAPPCYDTLPITLEQVAPAPGDQMRFIDAVENEETARAFRLRVRSCQQITCNASLSGASEFSLLSATVQSPTSEKFETSDVLVWVLFDAGNPGTSPSSQLTVNVPETGDTFVVDISSNVIAKPTVGSVLVLDRSGSMSASSGVNTLSRMEVLKNSAPLFVHLLEDDDGIGVVRFDTDAAPGSSVDIAGGQIAGPGRTAALTAIGNHATNPSGLTAIGDGIDLATTELANGPTFMDQAIVVFTDGHETADQRISDVADLINSRVFAVGLGTADQLDPGALQDISDGTGGYLMLTGNPGPDDQILLQKYFAQVLAGVTNTEIVVDPEGFVRPGEKTAVPFDLTDADRRADIIVLSPYASALRLVADAPNGNTLSDGTGATEVRAETYLTLRVPRPSPEAGQDSAGTWRAILSLDDDAFRRIIAQLSEREQKAEIERLRAHGVPFLVTVQSRSSLRMTVETHQPSRRPGSQAKVTAKLRQAGIPLIHSASISVQITGPSGAVYTLPMIPDTSGDYSATIDTPKSGVYRLLVRAKGESFRGIPFTREEIRTLGVWRGGDERPDRPGQNTAGGSAGGIDTCGFLDCLIETGTLDRLAEENGVDLGRVRECLKRHCKRD